MHITPPAPTMTIARVRELTDEMAKANTAVVCSFTRDQLVDLLAEIDLRTRPAAPLAPSPSNDLAAVAEFSTHRRGCERCARGGAARCETGQHLYGQASASLLDQARILL